MKDNKVITTIGELKEEFKFIEKEYDRIINETTKILQQSTTEELNEPSSIRCSNSIITVLYDKRSDIVNHKESAERIKVYADGLFLKQSKYLCETINAMGNFAIKFRNKKSQIDYDVNWQALPVEDFCKIEDEYNFINSLEDTIAIEITPARNYKKFLDCIVKYREINSQTIAFSDNGTLLREYKNRSLEDYNLSNIDWENKDIAGIDISSNIGNVTINFDNLVKTLENANISGYRLDNYYFQDWNLKGADLRNTGASIDLATCKYTVPSKTSNGTLFDEKNKFYIGQHKLSLEEVENIGIKIYTKKRGN